MVKSKILYFETNLKAKEADNGDLKITGYASTGDIDRVNDVVLPEAWSKGGLTNYKKNPIILFNHNYDKPIGRATAVSVTDKGLSVEATISKAASEVWQLIKDGVLSTFSVSFRVKDAEYDAEKDLFIIKDAELFETSVVSLPCNQDATFEVAKSFNSDSEYQNYVNQFIKSAEQSAEDSANAQDSAENEANKDLNKKEKIMDKEQMEAMVKQVAEETAKALAAEQAENSRKAAEDAAAAQEEEKQFAARVKSNAETLMQDIEDRFKNKNEELSTIVTELKDELKAKSEEIDQIRKSKRSFVSNGGDSDWKKNYEEEIADNFVLGLATGKGWDTKSGKELIEKVNTGSGVEVSSADFEQLVSTTIERDVQNELILAPLFREITMNAATMIMPIMPDSGYAEFAASNALGTQTAPHGNLNERGETANNGVQLAERTLTTYKLISTSYLGNETEEDAIMPILPLIREAMIRSHARSVENAILLGNHADGAFTSGTFDGLVTMADADSDTITSTTAFPSDALTANALFGLRKGMGKYGLRPQDVVYVVSQQGYFELIEDAEFQDANLVGEGMATKIKGSIGQVFGSPVIVCDEFADAAVNKHYAVAVNVRNFLKTKLRGFRVESDYSVKDQNKVLVATQRIGFFDLIEGVSSKQALQYASA